MPSRLLTLLVACVLALAGCGGGGDEGADSPGGGGAADAGEAADQGDAGDAAVPDDAGGADVAGGGDVQGGVGEDGGSAEAPTAPGDKRAAVYTCLREAERLPARLTPGNGIQVGAPPNGPRIQFFLTAGEAEARQFAGEAQGAEQIGRALLWVNGGSDELLKKVEGCLQE